MFCAHAYLICFCMSFLCMFCVFAILHLCVSVFVCGSVFECIAGNCDFCVHMCILVWMYFFPCFPFTIYVYASFCAHVSVFLFMCVSFMFTVFYVYCTFLCLYIFSPHFSMFLHVSVLFCTYGHFSSSVFVHKCVFCALSFCTCMYEMWSQNTRNNFIMNKVMFTSNFN